MLGADSHKNTEAITIVGCIAIVRASSLPLAGHIPIFPTSRYPPLHLSKSIKVESGKMMIPLGFLVIAVFHIFIWVKIGYKNGW